MISRHNIPNDLYDWFLSYFNSLDMAGHKILKKLGTKFP